MYLRDYLHDIPLKALKALAESLKVPVEYGARIKLINAIDRAFWDGSLSERLIDGLPEDRRRVLSLLAFSFGAGVHERALVKKAEKLSGVNRETILALVQELIPLALAGGVKEDEDNLFFCPRGVAEQARKSLISDVISFPDTAAPIPSITPPNLLEDIYSFLAEAYKVKIPLTLMGHVKKTILDRIFNGSITCSDPVLKLSKEDRNKFVIDYLKTRKLITFDRRRTQAKSDLTGWLNLTMSERFKDIISFALSDILQDGHTITAFTGIICEIPARATFDASELAFFLHSWTMAPGGFSKIEERIFELLTILYHLGMLSYKNGRFVMTVTGELLFRGKSLPMDENTADFFTVQPNFEIIVGPEIHPLVRFKLELLTDRKNRDMVLTYEVTQNGITRARERDLSTDDILEFLESHSRTPLPQNVRFSVENWARTYGIIFFERTTLMRFRDESACSSVLHLAELTPYIKEKLSDKVLVVSPDHIKTVTDILKNAGYHPEVFGKTQLDTTAEGKVFQPTSIEDILEEMNMPIIHSYFIFPDNLFPNGNSK